MAREVVLDQGQRAFFFLVDKTRIYGEERSAQAQEKAHA